MPIWENSESSKRNREGDKMIIHLCTRKAAEVLADSPKHPGCQSQHRVQLPNGLQPGQSDLNQLRKSPPRKLRSANSHSDLNLGSGHGLPTKRKIKATS